MILASDPPFLAYITTLDYILNEAQNLQACIFLFTL